MLRRKRVLAAKAEGTAGTAESLTAAEAAFNVFDSELQPTIEFNERPGQSSFDPLPGTLGAYGGVATFQIELMPATTSLPLWATTFLPACGLVVSTATYTPRTEAPGSNVKTLTIGGYIDGLYKQIHGAMGNVVFTFPAGRKATANFTFMGIWSDPSDVAILAPTYPTTAPLRFVSSAFAIGGYSAKVEQVTIDLGNQVIMREDASTASGYSTALITGRRITGTMNPESTLVATKDWYTEWTALTEQSTSFSLSSGGIGLTFTMPKTQITNIQGGDRNGLEIEQIDFQANRNASAGDDSLSILFDLTA